jgi:hypothetical protein
LGGHEKILDSFDSFDVTFEKSPREKKARRVFQTASKRIKSPNLPLGRFFAGQGENERAHDRCENERGDHPDEHVFEQGNDGPEH